jgi:hypothetical protein
MTKTWWEAPIIFIDDLPKMLPTKFRFIWPSGYRGDVFLEINQSETRIAFGGHVCQQIGTKSHFVPIRYQTWPPQTILVSDWVISKKIFSSCFLPSFDSFGQAVSEEMIF